MIEHWMLGMVCAINFIGALCFFVRKRGKQEKWVALFFLMLPVFGFLLYGCAGIAIKANEHTSCYQRDDLVPRMEVPDEVKKPNIEDELAVVAMGDALSISTNQEKRGLVLNQLKKEDKGSYKALLTASRDDDSETAHYVATAKVTAYEKAYDALRTAKKAYQEAPTEEGRLALLEATRAIVGSGVLSSAEQRLYHIEYCNLVEANRGEGQMPEVYLDDYVDYLIQLERTDDLLAFWADYQPNCHSERIYRKMLALFYRTKDRERFACTVEQVKGSDIVLSTEGLATLRFWMN